MCMGHPVITIEEGVDKRRPDGQGMPGQHDVAGLWVELGQKIETQRVGGCLVEQSRRRAAAYEQFAIDRIGICAQCGQVGLFAAGQTGHQSPSRRLTTSSRATSVGSLTESMAPQMRDTNG